MADNRKYYQNRKDHNIDELCKQDYMTICILEKLILSEGFYEFLKTIDGGVDAMLLVDKYRERIEAKESIRAKVRAAETSLEEEFARHDARIKKGY